MNNEMYDVEEVKKRFEDLDSGLNAFMQSVKEIKEIRDTVGDLPEKIKINDERIESHKRELEQLMSSTNNVFISFEEKSKGVLFDIEKKTEALTDEVKAGIAQIGQMFEQSNVRLHDRQHEGIEEFTRKYEEMISSIQDAGSVISRHEQSIEEVTNSYRDCLKIIDKMEHSLDEMKKSLFIFQKKPYVLENKINEIDERLTSMINERHASQKALTWILMILVMAGITLSFAAFYYR